MNFEPKPITRPVSSITSVRIADATPTDDLKIATELNGGGCPRSVTAAPKSQTLPLKIATAMTFPTRIDLREAFENPPGPLDFVLPGMLAGTIGGLISPGGVGKSFLSLEWAVLVGAGVDLLGLGQQVPTGRVLMLCLEDPVDALRHRLFGLGKYLDPAARERIHCAVDVMPLVGRGVDLMDDNWFDWILERAYGVRLLLIDTLRRAHSLEENDGGQMAALLGRMERIALLTGCSIVFLHHTTKSAALNQQGDMQQASRGSSVLTDNIRWQCFLSGMSKDEAKEQRINEADRGSFVRFGTPKRNYGPPIADNWLRRAEGGILVPADFDSRAVCKPRRVEATTSASEAW